MMKFIHAGLNVLAFILAVISVAAVFDFHNAKNIPNMYSLHSWVGLAAVILYPTQVWFHRHTGTSSILTKEGYYLSYTFAASS